jgi:hypothetical protein
VSPRIALRASQVLGLALLLALPGGVQYGQMPTSNAEIGGRQPGGVFGIPSDTGSVEAEKRLKALNAERQKSLVSDTNKLLKLAHELDDDVNHDDQNSFNQSEMTKAAEIEKLAHKVKEKMSTSVRSPMNPQPFPTFPVR